MSALVSVIVPCYNAEKYLEECVDSLRSQTMRDFEAVFINDGSTDRTAAILEKACGEDSRFTSVTRANGGVSAARNAGLELAKGKWVFFLDADDVLSEDCLEKLLSAASEDNDLVIGMHAVFGNEGKRVVFPEGFWWSAEGDKRRTRAALRLIEGDSVLNIMCNKLHRRSFLIREEIRLDEGLKVAEDALFNLQAVMSARAFAFCRTVTYFYRSHSASATHATTQSHVEIHRPWLMKMGEWLAERGFLAGLYRAYADSVILRFYKDGGIGNVFRSWRKEIRPLLMGQPLQLGDLRGMNRAVYILIRSGVYPYLYPFILPCQIAGRKMKSFLEWLDRKISWRGESAL